MCDNNISHLATKITPTERARQFPDVLHESGGKLLCTACNVVVEHKRKSSIDKHFSTAKHAKYARKAAESCGQHTRQLATTEAGAQGSAASAGKIKENPAVRFLTGKRGENLKPRISNAKRFPCTAPAENIDQYPELMDFLPKEYQYHVCSYKEVNVNGDHTDFEATLRMSLTSKEEILVWLKLMPVTWRVDYTRPTKGSKVIFRTEYRCQHNTRSKATRKNDGTSKNTDCPAKLKVGIARTEVSHRRPSSTDPHIPNYPTLVEIINVHNHNIHALDALRHRDVGRKAVEQLTELFTAGHSPSSALNVLKSDLQVQFGKDYINALADRSICPDLQFCYRLYYKMFRKEYGSAGDDDRIHEGLLKPLQDHECSTKVSSGSHLTTDLSNCGPETSAEAVEELETDETPEARVSAQEWDSMSQEFAAMVQSSEEFQVAGSAFLKAFNRLKGNPSVMRSAMHMFGRYNTGNLVWKQSRDLRRNRNSVASWKFWRRRRFVAGSQKKNVATVDHHYSNPKGKSRSLLSCRRVTQQSKTMDAPSSYPTPSSPLLKGWTHDHCASYQAVSP
ncbi:uncharacterized protein si:dkey-75a21.2 isoform X2 [Plectropomus leopardus]|uniref:uncharacterized protein si:dkey-75a21.2 isoform X2 n=1 Tax=Plectropomus leopardus TaxID=160734 RepID=UPI001C4DCE89|nr:uncharacterized protein si:dkey-75a21.2 isoform X2 [Plectropomus leopardus]